MTWVVRIGLGIVALVVALAVIVPMVIDTGDLVGKAEEEASGTLGREVTIGGVSGISVFPPRLTITGLTIASGDGFESPDLVKVEEAQLGVRLWPLLSSRVEIERFILRSPRIALETKADGTNNYTFKGPSAGDGNADSLGDAAPVVGTIVVENGSVSWAAPNARYEASNADLLLVLPPLGQAMTLDGTMDLEGLPARVRLEVAEPWAMTAGRSSALRLNLTLAGNTLSCVLNALAEPLTINGPMQIDLRDVTALAPFIGDELVEAVRPLGTVTLEGGAQATAEHLALSDLAFTTALGSGSGAMALAMGGSKPVLSGQFSAGALDLRPFFPDGADGSEAIDADEPFPEWSDAEMDFTGLNAVNADVTLAAERIVLPTYDIENVAGRATLQNGRAQLVLTEGQAFGGNASGRITMNAAQATPIIAAAMTFAGINFADAAPALLSTRRLAGRGSIAFDMTTQGKSEAAWVDRLNGRATADIENGSINGVNLTTIATTGIELVEELRSGGKTLPAVQTALTGLMANAVAPDASTGFDIADFGVSIDRGHVRLGQAKLLSDTFRATVDGGVNLPGQVLDLSVKLSAKAPAETGYREFRLPIAVGGSFSEPRMVLDTAPLAKELARGAATEALGEVGISVGEGETLGDALRERTRSELRNLLGGRQNRHQADTGGTEDENADTTEEPQP